jgi:hypothetical protein
MRSIRDLELNYTKDEAMADSGANPVTRAELREELSTLRAEVSTLGARLTEQIRDSQTELLRAFHGWAGPLEQRMRGTKEFVMGFEERLTLLEERMGKVERDRL